MFTPGDLDHNSWESVELDAGHRGGLCLGAWGAGLEQGGFPESWGVKRLGVETILGERWAEDGEGMTPTKELFT